jgi:putative transcriptional regulator
MTQHGLIPDEWLVSYAAGALSDAEALVVASHLAYHPELDSKISDAEAVGGALLEGMTPADMAEGAIDAVLARLDTAGDDTQATPAPVSADNFGDTDIPAVLRDRLGKPLEALRWRTMGPGMKQCRLATGPDGEKLWLLRARGGTEMPVHDHRGTELTLVLRGSYHVGDKQFSPGLIEVADMDVQDHQPMIDEGEDCICLVVTDAPIRLHSLVGRMVQPFIGL